MPKSQYVDPGKVFERGFAEFTPIPLCQYNKTLKEEKAIYTKEDFLRIYRDMRIIREFETMLNEIKVKSVYNGVEYHNPGPAHLSIGQEASAVGQAYCLDINDFTFGSHRSHGEILAKGLSSIEKLDDGELYDIMKEFLDGVTLRAVEGSEDKKGDVKDLAINFLLYGALAEIFARTTGFNRGLGGSMHAFFIPFGIFGIGSFFFSRFFGLYHIEVDRSSHESAVAVEHFAEAIFLQKFRFFFRNVQGDNGTAFGTVAGLHGESHAVLADPTNGFGPFGGGQSVDRDFVGHHKGGIEAKTEVTNDAAFVVPFVVLQKFFRAGESHLIDVFFHFFGSHADAIIGKADLFRFLVKRDSNTIVAFLIGMEHLFFGDGITAVGNHFADEDILIGIEPTLDDGHDVLCMNGNVAFLLLGHSRRLRDSYGVGVPYLYRRDGITLRCVYSI